MPPLEYSKETNFPLIRIIIAGCIGITIGYIIFSSLKEENQLKTPIVKGTICLIIDDYGFIFNDMVKDFIKLDPNITAAIIPASPYGKQIGRYADSLDIESIIHMPMESYKRDNINYEIDLNKKFNATLAEERVRGHLLKSKLRLA